jgi:hypothetical protein
VSSGARNGCCRPVPRANPAAAEEAEAVVGRGDGINNEVGDEFFGSAPWRVFTDTPLLNVAFRFRLC